MRRQTPPTRTHASPATWCARSWFRCWSRSGRRRKRRSSIPRGCVERQRITWSTRPKRTSRSSDATTAASMRMAGCAFRMPSVHPYWTRGCTPPACPPRPMPRATSCCGRRGRRRKIAYRASHGQARKCAYGTAPCTRRHRWLCCPTTGKLRGTARRWCCRTVAVYFVSMAATATEPTRVSIHR